MKTEKNQRENYKEKALIIEELSLAESKRTDLLLQDHYQLIELSKNQLIHNIVLFMANLLDNILQNPDCFAEFERLFQEINIFFQKLTICRTFYEAKRILIPHIFNIFEILTNNIEFLNSWNLNLKFRELKTSKNSFLYLLNSVDNQRAPFNLIIENYYQIPVINPQNSIYGIKFHISKYESTLNTLKSVIKWNENEIKINLLNWSEIISSTFTQILTIKSIQVLPLMVSELINLMKDFRIHNFLSNLFDFSLKDADVLSITKSMRDELILLEESYFLLTNLERSNLNSSKQVLMLSIIYTSIELLKERYDFGKLYEIFSILNILDLNPDLTQVLLELSSYVRNILSTMSLSSILQDIPQEFNKKTLKFIFSIAFQGITTDSFIEIASIMSDASYSTLRNRIFLFLFDLSILRTIEKITTPKNSINISKTRLVSLLSNSLDPKIISIFDSTKADSDAIQILVASLFEVIPELDTNQMNNDLIQLLKYINKQKSEVVLDIKPSLKSILSVKKLTETAFIESQQNNILIYSNFYYNMIKSMYYKDTLDWVLEFISQIHILSNILNDDEINSLSECVKEILMKSIGIDSRMQVLIYSIESILELLNELTNSKYEFLISSVNNMKRCVFTSSITGAIHNYLSNLPDFEILRKDFDINEIKDSYTRNNIKEKIEEFNRKRNIQITLDLASSLQVLSQDFNYFLEIVYLLALVEFSESLSMLSGVSFNFSPISPKRTKIQQIEQEISRNFSQNESKLVFKKPKRNYQPISFDLEPINDSEFDLESEENRFSEMFGNNSDFIKKSLHQLDII